MKKLHCMRAKHSTIYLDDGKGEQIEFLRVAGNLSSDMLKSDIDDGATHLKALYDVIDRTPSQYVLISCKNKEQGLHAITYLASIYNQREGYEFDSNGLSDEDLAWDDKFQEEAYLTPIISYADIEKIETNLHQVATLGSMAEVSIISEEASHPYWKALNTEPVVIVRDLEDTKSNYYHVLAHDEKIMTKALDRVHRNRHVYVLLVDENNYMNPVIKEELRNFVFKNNVVYIRLDEENNMNYYIALFESFVLENGKELCRNFPKKQIVNEIFTIPDSNKVELLESIVRYVSTQSYREKILKARHFRNAMQIFDTFEKKEKSEKPAENEHATMKRLDEELVGMEEVKEQIHSLINNMKYLKKRNELGLGSKNAFHNVLVLLGAPGTAKSTVAQIIADIVSEEGLLKGKQYKAVNGAELKGQYVGQSSPKVHELFEKNDIIFIDEAYSLTTEGDKSDSFSQEAISQLILELENHATDKLIMFAGYGGKHMSEKDNRMLSFINSNPGIRSRLNVIIYFDSYSPEQMLAITSSMMKKEQYKMDPKAEPMIVDFFEARRKATDYGNGREARALYEHIIAEAANRIMKLPEEKQNRRKMSEITYTDVVLAIEKMRIAGTVQKECERAKIGFC